MAMTFVAVVSIALIVTGCASTAPANRTPLRPNPRIVERDLSPPVIARPVPRLAGIMKQTSLAATSVHPTPKAVLVIRKKTPAATPKVRKPHAKRQHAPGRRK